MSLEKSRRENQCNRWGFILFFEKKRELQLGVVEWKTSDIQIFSFGKIIWENTFPSNKSNWRPLSHSLLSDTHTFAQKCALQPLDNSHNLQDSLPANQSTYLWLVKLLAPPPTLLSSIGSVNTAPATCTGELATHPRWIQPPFLTLKLWKTSWEFLRKFLLLKTLPLTLSSWNFTLLSATS